MKGSYSLHINKKAEKEIRAQPLDLRRQIIARIQSLKDNPRPPGCKKLAGRDGYRLRAGSYRIIYTIEDDRLVVIVVRVAHRRDVYRG